MSAVTFGPEYSKVMEGAVLFLQRNLPVGLCQMSYYLVINSWWLLCISVFHDKWKFQKSRKWKYLGAPLFPRFFFSYALICLIFPKSSLFCPCGNWCMISPSLSQPTSFVIRLSPLFCWRGGMRWQLGGCLAAGQAQPTTMVKLSGGHRKECWS